uniref:Gem nuclear organelle associated protein 8 n=1 Tax=Rhinopithecus roxellana TaxID=61622 RepID=A0A2K6RVN4_RHIRO
MAAVKASTLKAARPWYSHPVYARCWQHYHQAMAYRKAVESCFSLPWYFPPVEYPSSFYGHRDSPCSSLHFRGSGQHPHDSSRVQASTREDQALSKEEEMEIELDAEVECDLSNMEITKELCQYSAETERYREERQRYVNADHDLYCNSCQSVEAKMKRLYGDSATKIQAMEAAVQLSFDKHCDQKQPKYWPVIPLKF